MKKQFFKFWKSESEIIKYTFLLFFFSRIALTVIGTLSKSYFHSINPEAFVWSYSNQPFLDIWGVWDSGYYLDIAKRGYSQNQNFEFTVSIIQNEFGLKQTNLGFFPLYPLLIKLFSFITRDYYVSALIVSNLALLFASYFLYKLVSLLYDPITAKRSVKYLFLFPTAFIYSGVFTESLSLLFFILTLYLSELKNWFYSGVAAAMLSLTKFIGFVSVLPILISAFRNKQLFDKKVIISLSIIPFVLGVYFLYLQKTFADGFVNINTKISGWNIIFENPLITTGKLFNWNVLDPDLVGSYKIIAAFLLAEIVLIFYSYNKLPFSYWFIWFILILVTLLSGINVSLGIPRHILLIAPQFIALSLLSANKNFDKLLTFLFIFFQISLMALWVNGIAIM